MKHKLVYELIPTTGKYYFVVYEKPFFLSPWNCHSLHVSEEQARKAISDANIKVSELIATFTNGVEDTI